MVVTSVPQTETADAEPVTNPVHFTCLRRTGERHKLFVALSDPSPDAGYQRDIAALRVAGHYVPYVSEFIQNNPEGSASDRGSFQLVDVARHDRRTIALPDPSLSVIGAGEVAVSVDGCMASTGVNPTGSVLTETVEADSGGGPIIIATAAIPAMLTRLAFHMLAFHGDTLTWLYHGRRQSAQLKPLASTKPPTGSLSNGSGSALGYSVQANTTANAFELSVPAGDLITATSTPPGFSCTDSRNVEECKDGSVQPSTPVTGSFDHTGTIAALCGCVEVAFSADDGATWSATGTSSESSPPAKTPTSLTLSCPRVASAGG